MTFALNAIHAENDTQLREGIMLDTLQFRWLVSKILQNNLYDDLSKLQRLPKGMVLFFSEIFTDTVKSKDLEDVNDYSFFQLFHPVFFDSRNRSSFI